MAIEKLIEQAVNLDLIEYLKGIPQEDIFKIGMDQAELTSIKTRLNTIRKDGRIMVNYEKGRSGRYTTKKGLQTIRGKLRRLMTPDGWGEIDLVNAHFKIIQDEAQKCGLSLGAVEAYNRNRDDALVAIGGSRGDAKVRVLRVLYGGKPADNDHEIIHKIHEDMKRFKVEKLEELANYTILAKQFSKKAGDRDLNTGLAYYCFERESKIMEIAIGVLRTGGYEPKIHIHDGIVVANPDEVTSTVYNQIELLVKQELGFNVEFDTKSFNATEADETWYQKVQVLSKYNPKDEVDVNKFTDVDIGEMVFSALKDEGSRIVKCEGNLYIWTTDTGYFKKLSKGLDELYGIFCKDKIAKKYVANNSKYQGLKKIFQALIKEDPELTMKASNVSGYICMGDGTMWDMKNKERIDCSQDVVFVSCMTYIPTERNDALIDIIKEQLFYKPLGKAQGNFLLNCLARGLGKEYEDKRLFLLIGMSNAGKGVIMNAMERAFAGLVGHFNAEDMMYKRGGADTAKSLSWALDVSKYPIGFSNEVEMGEGCSLSGNLIKKGASGGDVLKGRFNHKDEVEFILSTALFCAMNDLPNIKPLDEGVRNRLYTFNFQKAFVDKVKNPDYELQGDREIKSKIKSIEWKSSLFWAVLDAYTPSMQDAPRECREFKEEMIEDESDEAKIKKLFVGAKNGEFVTTQRFHKSVLAAGMVMTVTKLSTTMKRNGYPTVRRTIDGVRIKGYEIVIVGEEETNFKECLI
tara:strand:+ start:774 stop:3008 length:2235 start_codon:yes stop_codon:yes gene_type:complete